MDTVDEIRGGEVSQNNWWPLFSLWIQDEPADLTKFILRSLEGDDELANPLVYVV